MDDDPEAAVEAVEEEAEGWRYYQNSPCVQPLPFATIAMYSWWQPNGIGSAYRI